MQEEKSPRMLLETAARLMRIPDRGHTRLTCAFRTRPDVPPTARLQLELPIEIAEIRIPATAVVVPPSWEMTIAAVLNLELAADQILHQPGILVVEYEDRGLRWFDRITRTGLAA